MNSVQKVLNEVHSCYWLLAMGILLLTGSLVNLVKYRTDERISAETAKIEKARTRS
ncbi:MULTISPECIES: hypothetical protein [unclassified Mesorhizobium]|uniref:hypothetical protein n=1 Tax=unclassified Mesorhizobium TaxID=325217 RepID=UPI0015E4932A|nr:MULTISPECIES: hypothetical protein [unclassified Mesorhizobium]